MNEATEKQAKQEPDRVADDWLDGGAEIAAFLGRPVREIYHLHRTKRLPIGKLGRKLVGSRRQLSRAAKALTAA